MLALGNNLLEAILQSYEVILLNFRHDMFEGMRHIMLLFRVSEDLEYLSPSFKEIECYYQKSKHISPNGDRRLRSHVQQIPLNLTSLGICSGLNSSPPKI